MVINDYFILNMFHRISTESTKKKQNEKLKTNNFYVPIQHGISFEFYLENSF